jgi:hypothetical protein
MKKKTWIEKTSEYGFVSLSRDYWLVNMAEGRYAAHNPDTLFSAADS